LIWTQRPWFQWFSLEKISPFCKKYFQKWNILFEVLYFRWKQLPKIFTIAHNMKGCLRFYIFIFLILLNLAKFMYGLSLIEQHHEVEKKNTSWFSLRIFKNNLSRFWAFLFTMAPTWDLVHSRLRKRVWILLPIVRK
jgi:hypothetical protein